MRTFNYVPANPIRSRLTNLGLGVFMILLPIFIPFGIRIGNLRILGPIGVMIVLIGGGIVLLYFTLSEIRKARALAAQGGGKITVEGDKVTYPDIKKGALVYKEFLISNVEKIKYDEEDHQSNIDMKEGPGITLEVDHFDSWEEYEAFVNLLKATS